MIVMMMVIIIRVTYVCLYSYFFLKRGVLKVFFKASGG